MVNDNRNVNDLQFVIYTPIELVSALDHYLNQNHKTKISIPVSDWVKSLSEFSIDRKCRLVNTVNRLKIANSSARTLPTYVKEHDFSLFLAFILSHVLNLSTCPVHVAPLTILCQV